MSEHDETNQTLLSQLSHHIIGLLCWHTPTQANDPVQEGLISASAFVISIKGIWHLATAGHFFQAIEIFRKDHPTRHCSFWLADSIRPNPKSTALVPLDFDGAWKHYIYNQDDGIDFGLIELNPNTCKLLSVNNVRPVQESHWQDWSNLSFFGFVMVGIPFSLLKLQANNVKVEIVMLTLRKLEKPPERLKDHRHPMFYGEIVDLGDIPSIFGMSGCPVLGFAIKDGLPFYYFLAIQSGWLPGRRIVYACDLNYLVNILVSVTDELAMPDQEMSR